MQQSIEIEGRPALAELFVPAEDRDGVRRPA